MYVMVSASISSQPKLQPKLVYPVMAESRSLKVLETCRVAPPPETTASAAVTIPLSLTFEYHWLRFHPVERVFLYELSHPPSFFFNHVLPKLKHSLSLTLHYFLPLSGNITWPLHSPIPIITYVPGDALSLTVAESNSDFNHLSGFDFSKAEESRLLIPHLTISDEKASIMALQITLFQNSGFSIGVTTHHAAMDGKASTLFMKSWAYICSNIEQSPVPSLPENLIPFFDRSVIKEPTEISDGAPNDRSLTIMDFGRGNQENLVRGRFELTPSSILNLKKSAESKLKKEAHISSFSVTCAHVLHCLVKAEQTEQNRALLLIPVDCRSRLDPPIPPTYFGSCVDATYFMWETKSLLGEDGFVSVVEGISEALKKFENGEISVERKRDSAMKMFMDPNIIMVPVAGSPRFEVYGNDFGWGRPKKVEIVSIDKTRTFSLSESRSGNGGIEIGLVLKESVMNTFASLFLQGHFVFDDHTILD